MTETTWLTRRENVARGTTAFHFIRPAGFEFRAGQTIDLTLIDPPETDAEGNVRTFTIASAPFEEHLMIATRMRDTAFKRVLRDAPEGLEVRAEGPSGSFTLHKNPSKAAVFLAGGIGVTPFRSIVLQATKDEPARSLTLLYANRHPEDCAFLHELEEVAKRYPGFRFVPTMTDLDPSQPPWTGETGRIDDAMLRRHVPELNGPIYYLAGPPAMVTAMRTMLVGASVDEDDIRTEEFAGY